MKGTPRTKRYEKKKAFGGNKRRSKGTNKEDYTGHIQRG